MPIEDSDKRVIAKEKRNAKKSARGGKGQADFGGFVNAEPTTADKQAFNGWLEEDGLFSECLDTAAGLGFKFTVTYDERLGCYRATAANWDSGYPGAGICLSLKASEALRALARCVWWLAWKCDYKLTPVPAADPLEGDAW